MTPQGGYASPPAAPQVPGQGHYGDWDGQPPTTQGYDQPGGHGADYGAGGYHVPPTATHDPYADQDGTYDNRSQQ